MRLPNVKMAVTPEKKFTAYLLNAEHQEGRGKAQFFFAFGFSVEEWEKLALALVTHAQAHDVMRVVQTPFGTRYVVEGVLETPSGRTPWVRVVWFVRHGEDIPRLVTAYPMEANDD